jgi:hypothetical protein
MITKQMDNDIINSGAAESNKCVRIIFVLKTNVLNSEIWRLCMCTTSLAYWAVHTWLRHWILKGNKNL